MHFEVGGDEKTLCDILNGLPVHSLRMISTTLPEALTFTWVSPGGGGSTTVHYSPDEYDAFVKRETRRLRVIHVGEKRIGHSRETASYTYPTRPRTT